MEEQATSEGSNAQDISSNVLQFMFIFAVFYLGIFGILLVDELVLGTRYFDDYCNDDVEQVVFIIFYPLILIVRYALGIS